MPIRYPGPRFEVVASNEHVRRGPGQWLALLLAISGSLLPGPAAASAPAGTAPSTRREALEVMRDDYAGRWYSTLTFVQKTTKRSPDGKQTVETWYESLRHTDASGTQLRIDLGSPSEGNGVLYTATETRRFRAGKAVETRQGGNAL